MYYTLYYPTLNETTSVTSTITWAQAPTIGTTITIAYDTYIIYEELINSYILTGSIPIKERPYKQKYLNRNFIINYTIYNNINFHRKLLKCNKQLYIKRKRNKKR